MIFKRLFTLLFSVFLMSSAMANDIRQVEVAGLGATKQEAIYDALIEAVRQINGVQVASDVKTGFSHSDLSISDDKMQLDISIGKNQINKDISTASKGFVKEYDIINYSNIGSQWEVSLVANVLKYKPPGISPYSRRKIVIMPFRTLVSSYRVNNNHYTGDAFSKSFNQHLTNHITQTRRFTVLDREYMNEYLAEKNIILSSSASTDEQIKIGETLGADYIVVGKIGQASIGRKNTSLDIISESGRSYSAEFDIDYRIIVLATRQVKWSDTVSISLDQEMIDKLTYNNQDNAASQAILSHLASIISNQLMSNIYPLRVTNKSISGNTITLNQGGKSLVIGDTLEVMHLGESVVDPYTRESLGQQEHVVATVEIVRVLPKISTAKVISGSIERIDKLDIVRRIIKTSLEKNVSSNSWRKSDTKVLDRGGVVLPFD